MLSLIHAAATFITIKLTPMNMVMAVIPSTDVVNIG